MPPFAPTKKGRAAERAWKHKRRSQVAGPFRSESSVPSIRSKATKREHYPTRPPHSPRKRKTQRTSTGYKAFAVPKINAKTLAAASKVGERKRKKEAAAIAMLRAGAKGIPPEPQSTYMQARFAGIKPPDLLKKTDRAAYGQSFKGYAERQRETGGEVDTSGLSSPYMKARYKGIKPPSALKAQKPHLYKRAAKGLIENVGEHEGIHGTEDLTNLITLGIPLGFGAAQIARGVAKYGAAEIGAQLADQVAGKGESALLKAVKFTKAPASGVRAARNVGRLATRRARIPKPAVPERQFSAAVPGTAAIKGGIAQTFPVVKGHEQALVHSPRTTLETTLHAVPGFVTVPVGMALQLGVTGGRAVSEGLNAAHVPGFKGYSGREILKPVGEMGQEQLDFARQTAKVLTAKDSKFVQREVEQNLGLMLPIMLGLGAKGVADKIAPGKLTGATRRLVETVRSHAGKAHGDFRGEPPRIFEVAAQHRTEAIRTANARGRIKREVGDRTQTVRREAGRAKGDEVVRRGVVPKKKLGIKRKANLKIHTGDLVGFTVRNSIPLDNPVAALAEVKRIRSKLKPLPEGVATPQATLSTRDVLDFIERNPDVLADPHLAKAVDAYKAQAKHARETPGISPEHSERARFLSTAVTRDVPLPEEVFPHSIREEVRATPTRGKTAKDVLRREAKSDRSRARKLRSKAATRESRARAMRAELKVRQRTQPGYVVNGAIADRAARMDAQARTYRAGADKAEAMAKRKHKAATEIDPALNAEFVEGMKARLRKEGKPEPEYVHTGRAREAPAYGGAGAKLTQFPGRSKFKRGTAEEYGLAREGLTPTLKESIAQPVSRRESYKAIKGMLADNEFRVGGKKEWTSNEARQLFEEGVISPDRFVLVPRQLYKRSYTPDEWAAHLKTAMDADPAAALKSDRHFKIVRRAAAKEFFDQMGHELVSKHLARMNRATSYLILATSPAWAASQVVAEYGQGVWAQPKLLNPVFVRKAIKAYKALPAEKRQAFDSWVGVTHRTLDTPNDLTLGSHSGDAAISDAYSVFQRTQLGRIVKSIPQSIRALDEWKGGRIRVLTTAAKMDNELNGFLRGMRGLDGELGRVAKDLHGKGMVHQLSYVAEHPGFSKRYQSYLDDVMGNWSALTRNERIASQVVVFYPFVRMSLKWMLYSFPKNHPFRHALGVYLGQANAVHLKELLGGDPSFFTQWAQFPLHTGGGKEGTKLINLSRIAPGSNALIEAIGEPQEGAPFGSALLRVAQPALVAGLTAATGLNPLTGKQEAHSLAQAATQVASLSPLARVANEATLGKDRKRKEGTLPIVGSTERQEALDKLFGKLNEYGSTNRYVRTLGVPALPRKVGYESDLIHLRNLLGTMKKTGSGPRKDIEVEWAFKKKGTRQGVSKRLSKMEHEYDLAQKELDGLFRKYKVPYKKAEEEGLQRYAEIHYGAKPGTSGTTSFGGAVIGAPAKASPSSGSGVSTFAGKPAKGGAKEVEAPKERFYHPKETASTFGGKPAR